MAADPAGATVAARDEGIGLGPGEAEAISTPFKRTEEALRRQIQGLGLGLAIARAIAEGHGGTLEAASDGPGRGTTFTLRLPASRATGATDAGALAGNAAHPRDGG